MDFLKPILGFRQHPVRGKNKQPPSTVMLDHVDKFSDEVAKMGRKANCFWTVVMSVYFVLCSTCLLKRYDYIKIRYFQIRWSHMANTVLVVLFALPTHDVCVFVCVHVRTVGSIPNFAPSNIYEFFSNENRRLLPQREASLWTVPTDEMCRRLFCLSLLYCLAD